MNKYTTYFRRHPVFHPPHVADHFDTNLRHICEIIADNWHKFPNPHVVDNMIHTSYESRKWYYEVCDTPYRRGKYVDVEDIQDYWLSNQQENQHNSVFAHDQRWVSNLEDTGSVSCQQTLVFAPVLWIEMDRKDWSKIPDLDKALWDGRRVAERVNNSAGSKVAWAFTSGNNSSHVLINGHLFGNPVVSQGETDVFRRLALRITGDIRFGNGVVDPYSLERKELEGAFYDMYPEADSFDLQTATSALENLDPNIYRVNSLIRCPWSLHEATGNAKETLDELPPRHLEIAHHKPIFLYEYFKAWADRPKKSKKKFDNPPPSDYILNKLSQWIEDFNPADADANGWSGPYYSCLYKNDTNPSVYVHTKTGHFIDFGYQPHNLSFQELEYKMKTN